MSRRVLQAAAGAAVAVLAISGCGFKGAYSLPLPGGAAHGPQVTVTAVFDDVQDLVPDSAVRVNDVAVGDVKSITLGKDLKAHVTLSINAPVAAHLPANSVATLAQTSLLGEKYVSLAAPLGVAPEGTLHSGELLAKGDTTLPDVEQVFGLLSAVLNGGDLQDLQTINVELTKALSGRETEVRGALTQITHFVTDLNGQRQQINHALTELDKLSGVLSNQTGTIKAALTNLNPGLKVMADSTPQFVRLLTALSRFGRISRHLIGASEADTVANLQNLEPSLRHLAAAGSNLPHALEILITYPFPHNDGIDTPGDFTGLNASFCYQATKSTCQDASSPPLGTAVCALLDSLNLGSIDKACGSKTTTVRRLGASKRANRKHRASGSGGNTGGLQLPLPTPSLPGLPTAVPSVSPSSLLGGLLGGSSGKGHK